MPVIYDGAQGVGAVPVDVKVLGCAAYAGSGQKWLCGPDGSGMLYVAPEFRERVPSLIASYVTLSDPAAGLEAERWPDGRAWDTPALAGETSRFALASLEVLGEAGWDEVHTRARRAGGAAGGDARGRAATRCARAATRRSSRGTATTPPPSTSARGRPAC